MTLRNEPAIADAGAVVVEGFAIMVEMMIGLVVLMSLCTQRYDKDEQLNISFANDMRRISTFEMTDFQFNRKLIRYARYSLTFQWLSYFICHILILTHEFLTEPDIIDHVIYITFLINLSCLFLTFRNIGIYYFFPFTDSKNFSNPIINKELEEQKADIDEKYDEEQHDETMKEKEEETEETEETEEKEQEPEIDDHRRFSHHHYDDPDLMPDAVNHENTGNIDWDLYNKKRLEIRINLVHLFRCIAYTSIIYWVGYIIAAIHGKNDVVLATLALADILIAILIGAHMYYIKELVNLFKRYDHIYSGFNDECDTLREDRIFQLNRWFRADIGIICVLMVKCIVLLVSISTTKTSFSWPASHPVFLATTFVIIASCQMTCCRYIWITKTD